LQEKAKMSILKLRGTAEKLRNILAALQIGKRRDDNENGLSTGKGKGRRRR
jgi:hypothetical protein